MCRNIRKSWKILLFTLLTLCFSISSFSCTTLSSLGEKPAKKGYPAYSTAPLNIPSVSKYVNGISNWTYHTPIKPGPLPSKVTETFRSGSYVKETLSEPVTLYRVYSGV